MSDPIDTNSPIGMLTLLGLRGVGPKTAERLASRFSTLDAIRGAPATTLESLTTSAVTTALLDDGQWAKAEERARAILAKAAAHEMRVLTPADDAYPGHLRQIPDRPPVIYVWGQLHDSPRSVASVGTRFPSDFGQRITRHVAGTLADAGWSIVSGLALGVDTLSHEAALDANGHTVAVLANGLDKIYPRENEVLAARILSAGGALISELPPGTRVAPRNLVRRDRIQSGMSVATMVMQTAVVGGSMHTVQFTVLQGRPVYAPVPEGADAEERNSQGLLALLGRRGPELATLLGAKGRYAKLLGSTYANGPVARPIDAEDVRGGLMGALEAALGGAQSS